MGRVRGMSLLGAHEVGLSELSESLGRLRVQTPQARQAMEESLSRLGQLAPLLTYQRGSSLEVIDGFKRLSAARSLSWTRVQVVLVEVEAAGAKVRMWTNNNQNGLFELEEAWLIQSMYREDGLTQVQIGQLMNRHKSWVNRRLMLAEGLCEEVQASVRLGLLSPTSARELCRLPRGNQAQAADTAARQGLTTRQVTRLVDAMLSNRGDQAETPARPDATSRAKKQRGRKQTASEWLTSDADAMKKLCGRLEARLLERPLMSFGPDVANLCADRLDELKDALTALCQLITARVSERTSDDKEGEKST